MELKQQYLAILNIIFINIFSIQTIKQQFPCFLATWQRSTFNDVFDFLYILQMQIELIGHGAQAKVYRVTEGGKSHIEKQRLPKKYRHPELDKKINQSRIKSESKIMEKLHKLGLRVPKLHRVDQEHYSIHMQDLQGIKLKDYMNDPSLTPEKLQETIKQIGTLVLQIHECGIIHGDLTTSNMILKNGQIYLIDFGLSYFKDSAEDRAVDLYVLERAFKSTHPQLQDLFNSLLVAYGNEGALKKLEVVRQRGRKKIAFG